MTRPMQKPIERSQIELGAWTLKFLWSLVVGIWCFPAHAYPPIPSQPIAVTTRILAACSRHASGGCPERRGVGGMALGATPAQASRGGSRGTFRRWHENGQLAEQIEMKNDKPDGVARAYYPSGFLQFETQVRAGVVVARHSHQDGEQRVPE